MSADSRIDLVVPGLFGPVPLQPGDLPDLPSLSRLLGRTDPETARGSDPIAVLFDRFGIELEANLDLPSAPFSRLTDAPNSSTAGYWLHADPVHLRPDRDRLLLFDARHLQLEQDEADSLAELFNGHFAADGIRLEIANSERWYLRVDSPPRLQTRSLAEMVGRPVDPSYLVGADAPRWMGWLNETQMLFHGAEVNQRRELGGKPAVSGIWLWGGGCLPEAMSRCPYDSVFAADSLATGLAKAAKIPASPLPDEPLAMLADRPDGKILAYWDALWRPVLDADGQNWTHELRRLETRMDGLLDEIRSGGVGELDLYPCNGTCLKVTRKALRRFWRRPVSVSQRLEQP